MFNLIPSSVMHGLLYILVAVVIILVALHAIGITTINTDEAGIVQVKWSGKGALGKSIIALNGESGFRPELLRAGIHFKTPFKYKIHKIPLITIPSGMMGYVFARDGKSLSTNASQKLGKLVPECEDFQDARAFLVNGGQKGSQRGILKEGTYAINLAQFIVITKEKVYSLATTKEEEQQMSEMRKDLLAQDGFRPVIINGSADSIGIVTVNEGASLDPGETIAPEVGSKLTDEHFHNNFQDIEEFLAAGGRIGKQFHVLTDGTFFINRLFAVVELQPKTIIDRAEVGVVVSYYGKDGEDTTGDSYSHGELVPKGCKGMWDTPLQTGKYAFNTYAAKIIRVPTVNVILKWINGQGGDHKLDENLKEVSLITKDAFEPNLPLTVVMSIDYRKAPRVIQKFGEIKLLIEQSLDPMIAGYFKNIGQTKTLIQLIQERNDIQNSATQFMKEKFKEYDLNLDEVLIGTPTASPNDKRIDTVLAQLRDREVAREQIATYDSQQKAADKKRELNEAQAKAEAQTELTKSSIDIEMANNKGQAELKKAEQTALVTRKVAEAEKYKKTQEAEADKYKRIQEAEATAKATELGAVAEAQKVKVQAEAEAERVKLTAEAEAERVKLTADANAHKLETEGKAQATSIKAIADAEAEKEEKVGEAKGKAARALVEAYGGPELQVQQSVMTSFADSLKVMKAPLVPQTVIGSSNGSPSNAIEGILSMVLANMTVKKGGLFVDPKDIDSDEGTENNK